jgi:hypothetical protein
VGGWVRGGGEGGGGRGGSHVCSAGRWDGGVRVERGGPRGGGEGRQCAAQAGDNIGLMSRCTAGVSLMPVLSASSCLDCPGCDSHKPCCCVSMPCVLMCVLMALQGHGHDHDGAVGSPAC